MNPAPRDDRVNWGETMRRGTETLVFLKTIESSCKSYD